MQADNIHAFLDKARDDQRSAEILLEHGGPEWTIGFHCQQAAEKILKAVLIQAGINPPRSHDIVLLRQLLTQSGRALPADLTDVDLLDPYAVVERYPDAASGSGLPMKHALALVERVGAWAETEIGL